MLVLFQGGHEMVRREARKEWVEGIVNDMIRFDVLQGMSGYVTISYSGV